MSTNNFPLKVLPYFGHCPKKTNFRIRDRPLTKFCRQPTRKATARSAPSDVILIGRSVLFFCRWRCSRCSEPNSLGKKRIASEIRFFLSWLKLRWSCKMGDFSAIDVPKKLAQFYRYVVQYPEELSNSFLMPISSYCYYSFTLVVRVVVENAFYQEVREYSFFVSILLTLQLILFFSTSHIIKLEIKSSIDRDRF